MKYFLIAWVYYSLAAASAAQTVTVHARPLLQPKLSEWQQLFYDLNFGQVSAAGTIASQLQQQHPQWPLPYAYQGIVAARKGQWLQARHDFIQARLLRLLPVYRWILASGLAHSPRAADRQLAIHYAEQTVAADTGGNYRAAREPEVILAQLMTAPMYFHYFARLPAASARRQDAIASFAAYQTHDPFIYGMLHPFWGLTPAQLNRRIMKLNQRPLTYWPSLTVCWRLARKMLGDSGRLEAWRLRYRHFLQPRETLWPQLMMAEKRFPGSQRLQRLDGRWRQPMLANAWDQGELAQMEQMLRAAPASTTRSPGLAVWQARWLAAEGHLHQAQNWLMAFSLKLPAGSPEQLMPLGSNPQRNLFGLVLASMASLHGQAYLDHFRQKDILYWQANLAYRLGDYAAAAAGLESSAQIQHVLNPLAELMLAESLEKTGHRRAAWDEWRKIYRSNGYGIYGYYAAMGLRETGGKLLTPRRRRRRFEIQGYLYAVRCRKGRNVRVTIANGSIMYPLRLARGMHFAVGCGRLSKPLWGLGRVTPDPRGLPRVIGTLFHWRRAHRFLHP